MELVPKVICDLPISALPLPGLLPRKSRTPGVDVKPQIALRVRSKAEPDPFAGAFDMRSEGFESERIGAYVSDYNSPCAAKCALLFSEGRAASSEGKVIAEVTYYRLQSRFGGYRTLPQGVATGVPELLATRLPPTASLAGPLLLRVMSVVDHTYWVREFVRIFRHIVAGQTRCRKPLELPSRGQEKKSRGRMFWARTAGSRRAFREGKPRPSRDSGNRGTIRASHHRARLSVSPPLRGSGIPLQAPRKRCRRFSDSVDHAF